MLAQYLPGIAFLALVSSAIALVFAVLVSTRRRAVVLAATTSTVLLKGWAHVAMGAFDVIFLIAVAVVAIGSALAVVSVVSSTRRRRGAAA